MSSTSDVIAQIDITAQGIQEDHQSLDSLYGSLGNTSTLLEAANANAQELMDTVVILGFADKVDQIEIVLNQLNETQAQLGGIRDAVSSLKENLNAAATTLAEAGDTCRAMESA